MSHRGKQIFFRWFFYILGLMILALGITLNAKTGFGVSPIISVPYCVTLMTGANFGNASFIWYMVFVPAEMILHAARRVPDLKKVLLKDILQAPFCLGFTRFINLFGSTIPVLGEAFPGQFLGSFAGRFLALVLAVAFTGCGAAMVLSMRIVPNPADGIVQAISDAWGKKVGFTKNCFDLLCVCITLCVGLLCTGHILGIGLGTVAAVLGVGRFVALYNRFLKRPTLSLAGLDDTEAGAAANHAS